MGSLTKERVNGNIKRSYKPDLVKLRVANSYTGTYDRIAVGTEVGLLKNRTEFFWENVGFYKPKILSVFRFTIPAGIPAGTYVSQAISVLLNIG